MENNEIFDMRNENISNKHEYCWYDGCKCGEKSCGINCPIYKAVTGTSLVNGF